jgi:hypothetical protein
MKELLSCRIEANFGLQAGQQHITEVGAVTHDRFWTIPVLSSEILAGLIFQVPSA